jgi:hypothetical protein
MKRTFLMASFSLLLFGCNVNPNKEARIQKLETELQQTIDKVNTLETSLQLLIRENEQLKTRMLVLEKQ